jgi:nucleotide-binding universal stress UspA family protein
MEKLWVMMAGLYGHKWVSSYGTSDIKLDDAGNARPDSGIWGKALAGISGQQIAYGMKLCTQRTGEQAAWPPSAPEFRDMCLASQSTLGIPDVAAAWREAVEASSDVINWKFSHPIVQEAAKLTDWYSIRHGIPKAETVQNRFNKRYADLAAKLQRGESLVDGQLLLTQEVQAGALEISDKLNDLAVKQRIKGQGLHEKTSEQLRADLLAKLGIKR